MNPALSESASWLINAGLEDTTRRLAAMTGTAQDIADLEAALAHEKARPTLSQRTSRIKPIQAKLTKFQKANSAGPTDAPLEIVTSSEVATAQLTGIAADIEKTIDLVTSHEDAFEEATLEHRLQIGLNIAKAQELFTASIPNPTGKNQHSSEVVSTVDTTPTTGFSGWLTKTIPRLKRGTAIRYANAFRALGLPTTAKTVDIRETLKTLRHKADKASLPRPTLAALVKASPKQQDQQEDAIILAPGDTKALRLGDAREAVQLWKDAWEKIVTTGQLDDLHKPDLEALKEFLLGCNDRLKARLK
jgi:hypothetical protein